MDGIHSAEVYSSRTDVVDNDTFREVVIVVVVVVVGGVIIAVVVAFLALSRVGVRTTSPRYRKTGDEDDDDDDVGAIVTGLDSRKAIALPS
jgi:hypothetical protein